MQVAVPLCVQLGYRHSLPDLEGVHQFLDEVFFQRDISVSERVQVRSTYRLKSISDGVDILRMYEGMLDPDQYYSKGVLLGLIELADRQEHHRAQGLLQEGQADGIGAAAFNRYLCHDKDLLQHIHSSEDYRARQRLATTVLAGPRIH